MSLPIDLTVILTKETNGVLMGIFINTDGEFQYPNGRVTSRTDDKAWWEVPDFTRERGVTDSGFYYVYTRRGYQRRGRMVNKPGGGVEFAD
ncbi:hypothetical protein EKO27_g4645 [Xylaria grammica]|uniref:Uncharacterized protein n=1 Tax=Xylaria grammica TaxID=363999 RepID=A0A439D7R5_9PEZI|nr:hypothetical protein EKO27_g4645 [Xylaria grammica]